jgi:type IX secretion system PorP/SprF family membrane protein
MGYVFDVSESIKVKPSYLIKRIRGNPLQLDVNCNFFLSEVLEVGLSWRSFESISTLIKVQLNPRFSIGYAYDLPAGSELSEMSTGSHEMMLSYRTPLKKVRAVNPRYF